jgi:hypothetical protein
MRGLVVRADARFTSQEKLDCCHRHAGVPDAAGLICRKQAEIERRVEDGEGG